MTDKRLQEICEQVFKLKRSDNGHSLALPLQIALISAIFAEDTAISAAKIQSDATKLAASYISQALEGVSEAINRCVP